MAAFGPTSFCLDVVVLLLDQRLSAMARRTSSTARDDVAHANLSRDGLLLVTAIKTKKKSGYLFHYEACPIRRTTCP